jgi:hypothetical protein
MDTDLRDHFISLWKTYFPASDLPLAFEFREDSGTVNKVPQPDGWRCIICQIGRARNGTPLVLGPESVTCRGGRMYSGYSCERPPGFRYFLANGKEGVVEGERYKQTPEIVDAWEERIPPFTTGSRNNHFTRWDQLTKTDNPDAVIFFSRPEVLSGLFTLANFDQSDPNGVICPMGAGCSSLIYYPWLEQQKEDPKVILGLFDPSARPCVPLDVLTMAFPMKKFVRVIGYMEESFLITKTWKTVQKKIERSAALYSKE